MTEAWNLKSEMAPSRRCTVFCPCVISFGNHPPTENRCQTWAGVRIDEGHFDTIYLLGVKVGQFLGVYQVLISYETQGDMRVINIQSYGGGAISPIRGKRAGESVMVRNSEYWVGSDVIVSRANKSRFRGFGRNRNLAGRSAEIVELDWGNQ